LLWRSLGTPGDTRAGLTSAVAADATPGASAGIGAEVITFHPGVTMNAAQEPHSAVTVLNGLMHRINHIVTELPTLSRKPHCGDQHAIRIEPQTLEQSSPISAAIPQLKGWRNKLWPQARHRVFHPGNRRHALPLPAGRFSRPHPGRWEGAECPLSGHGQWPCPRTVRKREQAAEQPRSRTIRVLEPAVSSQWQEPRPGPRAVRIRLSERPQPGRGQAPGAEASSPWTVHTPGQSTTKPWQRMVRVHEHAWAPAIPCPGTRSVRHRPECGPVQTQSNRPYVLV
jgi:hypothetical protein